MTMMPYELMLGGGGTVLLGVVGYFLRKTHEKIDATAAAVTALSENVDTRIDELEKNLASETKATRNEIVQIFQDICHERQAACSTLQQTKIDGALSVTRTFCAKLQKVEEDRDRRWSKQEELNEKFKRHIYKTKDEGSAWDLKE